MSDTREHKQTDGQLKGDRHRRFVRSILQDLRALEQMLGDGAFETGVARIGSEQEMFLVDRAYHAAPGALDMLKALADPHFTTELGLFNLEMNADPQPFSGAGLSTMEQQLTGLYQKAREKAETLGLQPVLAGILPTLTKADMGLQNMVPNPRYQTLNQAMYEARGEPFDFSIKGIDELMIRHDSVMLESACASFQVHLQLTDPSRFAHCYNIAQFLVGPVLAACTNSPVLFGRRLWSETRIALFEQSCDIRVPTNHLRESMGRVSFGSRWLKGSVLDLYKENVARFRPLIGTPQEQDSMAELGAGRIPDLRALKLHNGTIYRWNRPCYDISPSGKPHLRIEFRALPSGPTIVDEVANAALWLGLMNELIHTLDDLPARVDFDHARANLYAAARDGLGARLHWLDGEETLAQPLLLERMLPLAKAGLDRAGIAPADSAKYLAILEKRGKNLTSGSKWALTSLAGMKERGSSAARTTAVTASIISRQKTGAPVTEWELARLDEDDSRSSGHERVAQYMSTDVFTVRPDDPVELVAQMMDWERIRHIPVEDERGRLVGLVGYRAVLRHMTEAAKHHDAPHPGSVPVSEIMRTDLITIDPATRTTDAIALMRKHRIGCLPVVSDGHIVAIVTEEDFVNIASIVLNMSQPVPDEPRSP
jgi:CBS domain-containing protein